MFLKLRILFTILATVCLALILPALTWFGWLGFGICGLCALLFFGIMLLCKQTQEAQEQKNTPTDKKDENNKA